MASWIHVAEDSDFSLRNLPYGVFSTADSGPRIGVAIGNHVLDLKVLAQEQVFNDLGFDVMTLEQTTLNAYASLRKHVHAEVRRRLQQLLEKSTKFGDLLRDNRQRRERSLIPIDNVTMHLPMVIGDYTDFFIGLPHAINSAEFLKPGSSITQLIPSFWKAPAAYHGRSSTVIVSGTPLHRPKGQYRAADGTGVSGSCQRVDFEVEFAAFIGRGSEFGHAIDVDEAEDHIFGFVLLNDWSARDFQKNEIAPFTSKHFATSISPWIVPFEALEPFRIAPIKGGRPLPDYLTQKEANSAYEIPVHATLEVGSERYHVAEGNTKNVVFSFAQMIAHHTRGGCSLRPGDLLATGTISGPTRQEECCFMELTRDGTESYEMRAEEGSGASKNTIFRTYLEDGDVVEFTAQLRHEDGLGTVGFGVCKGQLLPSN